MTKLKALGVIRFERLARQVRRSAARVGLCASWLMFAALAAHAGEIYKWVDDQGITHMSDSVPEAYKARAKVVGSTEATIDPKDQAAARARAVNDAALLNRMQAPTAPAMGSGTATVPVKPAPAATGTDCASLYAAYRASQACYAPYVTVNGLRGGSNCTPVADPSAQCGSPTN